MPSSLARAGLLALHVCAAASSGAVSAVAGGAVYPTDVESVRVGHWLDLRGTLDSTGVFDAETAEILAEPDDALLVGRVVAATPRELRILDRSVLTGPNTRWKRVGRDDVRGRRVKIEVTYSARSDRLVAVRVTGREPGLDRIRGAVESVRLSHDGAEVEVLGLRVRLPSDLSVGVPLGEVVLDAAGRSRLDTDDEEDDQFGEGIPFGSAGRVSGLLDLRAAREAELDLDASDDEDRSELRATARARLDWVLSERVTGSAELRATARDRDDEDAGSSSTEDLELGPTYVVIGDPVGLGSTFVIGRQDFDDPREWLYDQNLDAIRWRLDRLRWRLETSIGTTLSDGSRRDESSTDVIAYLSNRHRKRHAAAYAVYRDFGDDFREERLHLGVRFSGRWLPEHRSWLELAVLVGSDDGVDRDGWAVDLGTTWRGDLIDPFYVTAGYALGSGDDGAGGRDSTFRQTGFQDNNAKFGGVTSFRYYGELVDPELANLQVTTIGVGVRLPHRTSIDLVFHDYRQQKARDRLINTALDRRPDGVHADLGQGIDLVVGNRFRPQWDFELVGSHFEPGAAFEDSSAAWLARVQARYRF